MANTTAPRIERIEEVWTPDAKLWTPYRKGEIAFASPSFDSNNYQKVGQEILSHSLKVPTGEYTASLLHSAYCNPQVSNEPEFKNVKDLIRTKWLWVFNVNNWNEKGVYVIQDLDGKGKSLDMPLSKLEKMILKKNGATEVQGLKFSKYKKVRFAPKGTYRLGEHTPESLSKDGWVIISYNFKGAKQLGEVSVISPNKPYTYGVEVSKGNQSELSVSSLGGNDVRLLVGGDDWSGDRGHAFGVL